MLLMLCGCGFKLRGTITIPSYLQTVYITPNDPYEVFQRELRYRLISNKVRIANQPMDGITTLEVSKPEVKEEVLAFGATDQAQRYRLIFTIKYKITAKGADVAQDQRTITRSREITKSNNLLLTNESEEQLVQRELLLEAVTELLRQITTPRPAHKAPVVDSSTISDNPC